jgi:hypothetical protein
MTEKFVMGNLNPRKCTSTPLGDSTGRRTHRHDYVRQSSKTAFLTFAFLEHLNASANSGILLNVPSTLYRVGECGSVRMRCTCESKCEE